MCHYYWLYRYGDAYDKSCTDRHHLAQELLAVSHPEVNFYVDLVLWESITVSKIKSDYSKPLLVLYEQICLK